jgi:UDPglucose 6-dehydrogenase
MNVAVVGGAGYVGLVTALGLAHLGNNVVSVDKNAERVAGLKGGVIPFNERGLQDLLKSNVVGERIKFTSDVAAAVSGGDIVFITVDTPLGSGGIPDLSSVLKATREISEAITSYKTIVIKSTVPTGAVEQIESILSEKLEKGRDFDLVMNPEFLREGEAVWDFFHPARIVIGTEEGEGSAALEKLYESFQQDHPPIPVNCPANHDPIPVQRTDRRSAQIIKYAANAFLAMRISFVNEIAQICEAVDADVLSVVDGLGHDPRIGRSYLSPGLGFGGPCLEKDLRGLISVADDRNLEPMLLKAALKRNDRQIEHVISKIKTAIGISSGQRTVGILGLAFKPGTDDVRNSLALRVIDDLSSSGIRVQAYDPVANDAATSLRPELDVRGDAYGAAQGADVVAILTDWPEFATLDYSKLLREMSGTAIIDAQNVLAENDRSDTDVEYYGVGRPNFPTA